MVKLYGPLFSLEASGTVAQAITFASWKGRAYARQRVVPANPRTGPQKGMRAMLRFLSQAWAALTAPNKATWVTRAAQTNISPFNAYVSYNQSRMRHYKGPTKQDPATEISAAPSAPVTTPTGGVHQVQLSIADGATPPQWGWLIHRGATGFTPSYDTAIAAIIRTGTPTVYIDAPLVAATYYYRIRGIGDDGLFGTLEAEKSGAAT
jgi:hypothetical protein